MNKVLTANNSHALGHYYQQRLLHAKSEWEVNLILTVYNLLNINGDSSQENSAKHGRS
ncbi:hypothetical protein JCM19231_3601 [Vibrio ishigakensis]|uniref:Uncharacterized protein n=1 Tax=Vibrio ishigakensis TaxID=1481914 RepID=A0A0B8NIQ9_9VIBR|nr:hypothetical protein [Vibrio ishigakensis]GAM54081.1 hypothetical protein JCM19231_3601 [Vibrio ishigakensis]